MVAVALAWPAAGATTAAGERLHRDFDGDGRDDLALLDDARTHPWARFVYIVPGRSSSEPVHRRSLGDTGFTFEADGDTQWVRPLGDLDGDRRADVLVEARTGPRGEWGTFVVYGRPDAGHASLHDPSAGIVGARGSRPVWPIGDVDGDGRGDVLAWLASGGAAILPGRADRAPLPLARPRPGTARLRTGPFTEGINGAEPAGDVDGDGLGDWLLHLENYFYCGEGGGCGSRTFLVRGARPLRAVRVEGSYRRGFSVRSGGRTAGTDVTLVHFGEHAWLGDFDGDGRRDVVVSSDIASPRVALGSRRGPGRGRRVVVRGAGSSFSFVVAEVGDVDGDGRGDVAVKRHDDRVVVVLGHRPSRWIDLDSGTTPGFTIVPPHGTEIHDVDPIDVDADGRIDLHVTVGTPEGTEREQAPRTAHYVVFGTRAPRDVRLDRLGARGYQVR